MDAPAGPPEHPLIRNLLDNGNRFEFFQAVSLLERACPGTVPVGGAGPADREALRFRPEVTLGFPAGSIDRIEWLPVPEAEAPAWGAAAGPAGRYRLTITFLGLYGVDSPLPSYISEEILHEQSTDTTVRDFLDLFHHRIYSLLYRIWSKYRYHVQFRPDGEDLFTRRLLCLIGLGSPEMRRAVGLPATRLLRYAGLLVQRPRSAAALEAFLSDWFKDCPVEVTPCTGRWVAVPPSDRSRLGAGPATLGQDALLGSKLYDVAGQYRVGLGPLKHDAYRRFLPGGEDWTVLHSLTRFFVTDHFDLELELKLEGGDVPPLSLDPQVAAGLGRDTWLSSSSYPDESTVFSMRDMS